MRIKKVENKRHCVSLWCGWRCHMWVLVVRCRCVLRLLQPPLLQTLLSCLLERNTNMTRFRVFSKLVKIKCQRTGSIKEAFFGRWFACTQLGVVLDICMQNAVVRGRIIRTIGGKRCHLKSVVCVCYWAPHSWTDRRTVSSQNTPLTLCSASRSTRNDQRKEAGDAFGVFSAFPSPPLHFYALQWVPVHRWQPWLGTYVLFFSGYVSSHW